MFPYLFPFSSLIILENARKCYFFWLKWSRKICSLPREEANNKIRCCSLLTENTSLFHNKINVKPAERLFLGLHIQVFSANSCQKLSFLFFFSRPHCKSFLSVPLLCLAVSLSHTKLVSHQFLVSVFFTKSLRKNIQLNGLVHCPNFWVGNGFLLFTKMAFHFSFIHSKLKMAFKR